MSPEMQETDQIDFSQTETDEVGQEQETGADQAPIESTEPATEQPQKVVLPGREMTVEEVDSALAELAEKKRILAEKEQRERQEEWRRTAAQQQQTAQSQYERTRELIKKSAQLTPEQRELEGLADPIDMLVATAVRVMEDRFSNHLNQMSTEEQQYQSFKRGFDTDPEVGDLRGDDWAAREAYRHYLEGRVPKRAVISMLRDWKAAPTGPAAPQSAQPAGEPRQIIRLAPAATGVKKETPKNAQDAAQRAFERQYLGLR